MALLRQTTAGYPGVRVESFRGLLVNFCRSRQARVVVKGIRAVSDFDYELQMAQMNASLTSVDTVFVATGQGDMATGLATFAAEGVHRPTHFIEKVETADGEVLLDNSSVEGEEVVDADVRARDPARDPAPLGDRADRGARGRPGHPARLGHLVAAQILGTESQQPVIHRSILDASRCHMNHLPGRMLCIYRTIRRAHGTYLAPPLLGVAFGLHRGLV